MDGIELHNEWSTLRLSHTKFLNFVPVPMPCVDGFSLLAWSFLENEMIFFVVFMVSILEECLIFEVVGGVLIAVAFVVVVCGEKVCGN